jgi:hypothetical protein
MADTLPLREVVPSNPMTVKTSQGDVTIDITVVQKHPFQTPAKKVGIRLSGGADSAIIAYMLAIYKRDYRPDLLLRPVTCVNNFKPYQEIFAKNVVKKITELTGVEFDEHYVGQVDGDHYVSQQSTFSNKLYEERKLDIHFMGETMNPPMNVEDDWNFTGGGRDNSRNDPAPTFIPVCINKPIRNLNKQGVKELYDHFGVTDTLFPVTRSCEIHTLDFTNHCGRCWFCLERHWGFGRYV